MEVYFMATMISGIVTNGLVVPATPLPEGARVKIYVQADRPEASPAALRMTPGELRKLPREERQAIFAATAALAEEVYREDKDLTGFAAFSEEIDDDSD
jgi:hypothetical protein